VNLKWISQKIKQVHRKNVMHKHPKKDTGEQRTSVSHIDLLGLGACHKGSLYFIGGCHHDLVQTWNSKSYIHFTSTSKVESIQTE